MRRVLGLTVLLGLWAALIPPAAGAETPPPPKKPTVEELIAQLSSRDFRQRESAGSALAERADEALPALRKALPTAEPEARRRMSVLVQRVESRLLLNGKRVTAHYVKRTVADIAADLTKQTGYKIELQGEPPNPRLTLELKDVPFWEAFDRLALAAGMVPGVNDGTDSLTLMSQDAYVPYIYHNGPFRVSAQNLSIGKNLNIATLPRTPVNNNQNSDSFTFGFSVASEPRVPILGLGQPIVSEAEDDLGRSLVFPGSENTAVSYYNNGNKTMMTSTSVNLVAPARDAQKLKRIKGMVPVTLLSDQRPSIVVDKPLSARKKKYASPHYDLELGNVQEVPGSGPHVYSVEVTVKPAATLTLDDANWLNTLNQRVELLDEKGRKYSMQSINENPTPGSVTATFQFGPAGEGFTAPAKLILNHWVVTNHQVPFEFKDLLLP